jgi:hypothetical protein
MSRPKKCLAMLATVVSVVALSSMPTFASPPNPDSGLAAPFSPSGTIYRPECGTLLEAAWLCGGQGWR